MKKKKFHIRKKLVLLIGFSPKTWGHLESGTLPLFFVICCASSSADVCASESEATTSARSAVTGKEFWDLNLCLCQDVHKARRDFDILFVRPAWKKKKDHGAAMVACRTMQSFRLLAVCYPTQAIRSPHFVYNKVPLMSLYTTLPFVIRANFHKKQLQIEMKLNRINIDIEKVKLSNIAKRWKPKVSTQLGQYVLRLECMRNLNCPGEM